MANFLVSATWRDEDNDPSIMRFHLVAADSGAAAVKVQNLLQYADVLSGAYLTEVTLTETLNIGGWTSKSAALVDSDVEIGGQFVFRSSTGSGFFPTKVTVPGFLKATYGIVGDLVDLSDAAVQDFTNYAEGTGQVSTSHWEDVASTEIGYVTFAGKRSN